MLFEQHHYILDVLLYNHRKKSYHIHNCFLMRNILLAVKVSVRGKYDKDISSMIIVFLPQALLL